MGGGESTVDWPAMGAGTPGAGRPVPTGRQVARKQTGAKQLIKVTGAYPRAPATVFSPLSVPLCV